METIENPELQLAFDFIEFTNRHVFLTGKAGTGKTTFLHNLKKLSPKRMIVVAPTGVAAINAGGVTIHSFFQLPFHPFIPVQYVNVGMQASPDNREARNFKMSRDKINIIRSLDLLVIDEISMVRSDLLDAVDSVLRRFKNHHQPFGGVQLLMIGDIQQLAPVVKEDDWDILGKYYDSAFFFGSLALRQTDYVTIELQHVYRQKDLSFITLLNKIRDNQMDMNTLNEINARFNPHFDAVKEEGYITLTTHNSQAQAINDSRLQKLPGKVRPFKAVVKDDFPDYAYPTTYELQLKTGAQVMFVKNDLSGAKLYFNGKIGRIEDFDGESITVQCPEDNSPIEVERVEWQNMKYTLDETTKEIGETVIGTFTQYPLKLAWAITIHKSQGLTFDRAIIDARAAFAHGQVYVALSRCRTLEGIVLSTPVSKHGIITDPGVSGFVRETVLNKPDGKELSRSRKNYEHILVTELFDFNTMLRNAHFGMKLVREHQSVILGNIAEQLTLIAETIRTELVGISEKFSHQLTMLLARNETLETNAVLQERISRACLFFSEKITGSVQMKLEGIILQTDNKEIRKSVSEALERLRAEMALKLACLEVCVSGFTVKKYLETKSRASVAEKQAKTKQPRVNDVNTDVVLHPALYNRIRSWRDIKALAAGVPHYMILPQKTIASLAAFLPVTIPDLQKVKGMGKKKSAQFGAEILEIIQVYCNEKKIDPPPVIAPEPASIVSRNSRKGKAKSDTRMVSLQIFKTGKSIPEIARERNMAISTIEEHLAHFIETGDIPVNEFVSPELTMLISGFFRDQGDFRLSPAKAALGDRVTWSDLKFVVRHLQREKPDTD